MVQIGELVGRDSVLRCCAQLKIRNFLLNRAFDERICYHETIRITKLAQEVPIAVRFQCALSVMKNVFAYNCLFSWPPYE